MIMLNVPEELIDYFARSNVDVHFLLPQVRQENKELKIHIDSLVSQVTEILNSGNDPLPFWAKQAKQLRVGEREDWAAETVLAQAIAAKRLLFLTEDSGQQIKRPYGHADLAEIARDSDGLVPLSNFENFQSFPGLRSGPTVFEILPSIPTAIYSTYWTLQNIKKLGFGGQTKIRLDPLLINNAEDYRPVSLKMLVYGKPLDWERLAGLKKDIHGRWRPDPGLQEDVEFTDIVWTPADDGIHFICEEVQKLETVSFRASRYFHGIYVPSKQCFIHCDGAIRIYSSEELTTRQHSHVRQVGKIGKRVKIFSVQSNVHRDSWSSLVSAFFVWNREVDAYFKNGTANT